MAFSFACVWLVAASTCAVSPAQEASAREHLWILDYAGSEAYVYEVGTWKLLRVIETGANPHGIAVTADGRQVFISNECRGSPRGQLIWIDAETLEIEGGMDVGHEPHEIECTSDGKFVYVPTDEGWEVVDFDSRRIVKCLRVPGRPHNTTIHPDGDRMFLSALSPAQGVAVVSLANHEIVDQVDFSAAPRPAAVSRDGRHLFQNLDGLLGYAIADLSSGVVERFESDLDPSRVGEATRFHGLAINERHREVWTANVNHHTVHIHSLDGHGQTHRIPTSGAPYWISMSNDLRFVFVANQVFLDGPRLAGKVSVVLCMSLLAFALLVAVVRPRLKRVCRIALVAAGIAGLCGLSLYISVKASKGAVEVYDAATKARIATLSAGRVPKRLISVALQ